MNVTRKTTLIRLLEVTLTLPVLHLPGVAQAAGAIVEPELQPPRAAART